MAQAQSDSHNGMRPATPNGVPLIGAYGSGQIAPVGRHNRLFQNTVVTLLFESTHV